MSFGLDVVRSSIFFRCLGSVAGLLTVASTFCGCTALRLADFNARALRLDPPANRAIPDANDPDVAAAIARWQSLDEQGKREFPTAYHTYVDTPAPGTFEGDAVVAMAFSGGGTRGTVFAAMCVQRLRALGDIIVGTPEGERRLNPFDEVDYVTGASTGAVPAAAWALNHGEACPEALRFDAWPLCFNIDVQASAIDHMLMRPHILVRDFTFVLNSYSILASTLSNVFFEGHPYRPNSGLTFADLPQTPVLFLTATIINDPGAPFLQTRLPYRFTLDDYPAQPWAVGPQSFETFHSDPLRYGLGAACANSSSFPGYVRAGRMAVRDDAAWTVEQVASGEETRMRRARTQAGYEGIYAVKDGGLVDNRAVAPLDHLFQRLSDRSEIPSKPLVIALDANYQALREPEPGDSLLAQGWFNELYASSRASWQTGQDAYERLSRANVEAGLYTLARFEFAGWTLHYPTGDGELSAETEYLIGLCEAAPGIGTPEHLLEVLRGIGTTLRAMSSTELEAIAIAADFAVWREKAVLLDWAAAHLEGSSPRFEHE